MAKMVAFGPLLIFDPCDCLGPDPYTLFHVVRGQPSPPASLFDTLCMASPHGKDSTKGEPVATNKQLTPVKLATPESASGQDRHPRAARAGQSRGEAKGLPTTRQK